MQPNTLPLQFEFNDKNELISAPLDSELAKDALAHVTLANYLYNMRKYKNKKEK